MADQIRRGARGPALAVAVVLALAACAGPATDHGTVLEKKSSPGFYSVTQSCTSAGRTTTCVPITTWIPPDWDVKVRDEEGTEAWLDVSNAQFDALAIGDYYDTREPNRG
ncbi:hypothetical protein ACFQHV_01085 [Promicromonospora thailandica]|uniref:Lipoprotein n=1 Tax=Promicromonospora thailandica TaxID=765201 RepID=A0A9X2G1X9_9MICO|nr:hypothetical protein [Promicromonospora thailandica]MCP2265552.1 hypothetical protein [Promicromonospora thailandica]BFF17117.1 hypothetical protein GCM10025730_06380 [Promicromonospora thailandica]